MAEQQQQQGLSQLISQLSVKGRLRDVEIDKLVLPDGKLDKIARQLGSRLKSTQLRRVFYDLKRLEQQARRQRSKLDPHIRTQIALTLPELAYAYGRGVIPKEFYDLMKALLHPPEQRFQDYEDVERLMQILTALLAYHKFHDESRSGR
ncbi:MAG: type III-A CRISPR-associated protein Csm2 [Armatimonadota bacterium]